MYYSQPLKVPQTEAQIMSTAVLVNILVSAKTQVHWGVNNSVELHVRKLLSANRFAVSCVFLIQKKFTDIGMHMYNYVPFTNMYIDNCNQWKLKCKFDVECQNLIVL